MKDNPKLFQSKIKQSVGPKGHINDDDKKMCNCVNEYFSSIFAIENLEYILDVECIFSGSPEHILCHISTGRI